MQSLNFGETTKTRTRTRTRTNTNPNDTKANAAGRRGVRVRSANGMCENQGAWAAKCLKKREALVGGVHSGNAHRKAPDLRNTKFHYSRGQKRLFSAQGALYSASGQMPLKGKNSFLSLQSDSETRGPQNSTSCQWAACGLADPPNHRADP